MASVWTIESLIYSTTSMNLLCWLPRLPSPFTSMKFLPVVTGLHPGRPSVSKPLAATPDTLHLAPQLTLVPRTGSACRCLARQIVQRCSILANMVQFRVALSPGMAAWRQESRPAPTCRWRKGGASRRGIQRTNKCGRRIPGSWFSESSHRNFIDFGEDSVL